MPDPAFLSDYQVRPFRHRNEKLGKDNHHCFPEMSSPHFPAWIAGVEDAENRLIKIQMRQGGQVWSDKEATVHIKKVSYILFDGYL